MGGASVEQQVGTEKPRWNTKDGRRPGFRGTPNLKGRPPGPNKFTHQLKEAILEAAQTLGEDGKGKNGLLGFLIKEAKKPDNSNYMRLLGRVLPLTIVGDKNRPLEVLSRVEFVAAVTQEPPRDVTPPRQVAPPVIDGKVTVTRPAPPPPVKVKAPARSGT